MMGQQEPKNTTSDSAPWGPEFDELYDRHVHEVYRFVHQRCRDHTLTEDITQETFIAALNSVDGPSSVSAGWLITVARNRLVDVLRRHDRHERKLRLVSAAGVQFDEVDPTERLRIESALEELSVDHRLVLTLHYIDGFTVPALAERLGRSVKSVEGLVTRARRELRVRLDDGTDVDRKRGSGD